ncbi:MAG TPA: DUF6290 family protein [Spirochaetota bacterium]|nr:hypothetical protein [Spirochaetota bacterium]HOT20863.1 DUF6290 family protein [Spirochaetota bacterium]HPD03970.1 DUF6290 family protein [Spirochaetota bacterium]HPK43831.1 DUF6290 family protein [Spirochaetota bacterium]HQG42970.1 DUF6290 family protein [Spirochaetota bacterium]
MAVTSVRFNAKEEKIVKILKKHYNCDASTLIKKSLWELYEDIKDKIIEAFEKCEKGGKTKFVTIDKMVQ